MKRKLFSAILFGALLTASTSGLTSCKDYDDDISNLQSQIDKLATADQLSAKVAEMQAAISAAQSAAEAKATAAQTVADAAKAAAADAAAAASKAQGTADDAAKAAAAASEVAKAAQAAVDKLAAEAATKAELEAAKEAAAAAVKAIQDAHAADKAAIEAAIETGLAEVKADIAKTNEELGKLATRLDAVEKKLAALEAGEGQEEALKEIQEEVEAIAEVLEDIIGEYTSMVTAVSLYASDAVDTDELLTFVYVPQEKDTKFPVDADVADAQIEFSSDNKNIMTTDKLLVRVSPTNAVLNAANISLLNSQGADLSDYVEVKAVKPYEELILGYDTRSVEGNGLWEVEFKVKDGVDAAKFAEAVTVKKGLTTYGIRYAVAVQNTESDDTRRVISAYDVEVQPEEYEPARTSVAVTNRDGLWHDINWVHNRYYFNDDKDFGAYSYNEGHIAQKKAGIAEYAWKNEPQVAGTTTGIVNAGVYSPTRDVRYDRDLVDVEVGKDINISVGNVVFDKPTISNPINGQASLVKGFYVTLDKDFAIESSPSEWNAWKSYSYTNVGIPGTSTKAKLFYGNEGTISINSEAALGDVIGFRVYVVNLDGTLVDPDGRAFYVNVATEKVVADLTAAEAVVTLHPEGDDDVDPYHFSGSNYYAVVELTTEAADAVNSGIVGNWTITENASAYGNNIIEPEYNDDYIIYYLNKKLETANHDAKYAVIEIKEPTMFLDEGSYTAKATVKKSNNTEICDLTVKFKKTLPTVAPVLAWVEGFDSSKQVFSNMAEDLYNISDATVKAVELPARLNTLGYGSGEHGLSYYTLEFQNVKSATSTGNVVTLGAGDIDTKYVLAPQAKDIDGKSHDVKYKYNFGLISLTRDNNSPNLYKEDYVVRYGAAPLTYTFASWIDYEVLSWKSQPSITYIAGAASNEQEIVIGASTSTGSVTVQIKTADTKESVWKYTNLTANVTTSANYVYVVERNEQRLVNGELKTVTVFYKVNYDENAQTATVTEDTWAPRAEDSYKREAVTKEVATTSVANPDNAIMAYNTVLGKYTTDSDDPVFGSSTKPINFASLIGQYVKAGDDITVSFSHPAFKAEISDDNSKIVFSQQTSTSNPTSTGVLTLTAKDCFGHAKSWKLNVTINQ